ncbi:MAG: hypothetical protein BWY78_01439 [Alphaproteobacteria bacterium ADurb.Bin438]|nr:MAG: hypothetical protein BWY78_01439 [Alphaproteobacteria bacterium ADurb.Bin438]
MFVKLFTIFISVFIAEFGDKTQVAALLFASDKQLSPMMVFVASSLALITASAIAVVVGSVAKEHLQNIPLKLIAGIGFILIGTFSIIEHFKS